MTLFHWVATKDGVRPSPNGLGYAYRIVDPNAWSAWLSKVAGYPTADLEIVQRTLRVRDQRIAARPVEPAREPQSVPMPTPTHESPQPAMVAAKPRPVETIPIGEVLKPKVASKVTAPPPAAPPKPASTGDPVKERVLALVAEKTGYPMDMLALDLDLEADLGVDTVKQAEMFAAIREIYNIPRDENVKLRDYPTLAHVIRFVHERTPGLATPAAPSPAPKVKEETKPPVQVSAQDVAGDSVKERILALVVEKTGYPKDMLDLDLDLEADLGVDTVKQAEMFAAIREIYNIPRDENRKLRDYPTLAHVIRFVFENRPDLAGAPSTPPAIGKRSAPVPAPVSAQVVTDTSIQEKVLEIVAEKSGYPKVCWIGS